MDTSLDMMDQQMYPHGIDLKDHPLDSMQSPQSSKFFNFLIIFFAIFWILRHLNFKLPTSRF